MMEDDVRAVPVMDGGCMIGFLSEGDYARSVLRKTATALTVREVMTPCEVFANVTDSAQQCLRLMEEHGWRYLPVQEARKPIALLPLEELLNEMVGYLARVIRENELDQQLVFLRGTYSC
jgi:predicted transcriptional regulator